jgi:hypothetical protein
MPPAYPKLDFGKETGVDATRLRVDGRNISVCGAYLDGAKGAFDNGILHGKSKVEQGITFGPEVLRALKGRRVFAVWLAAALDEAGRPGWHGLTVAEMRIDAAAKDGFKDPNAFGSKMMDAAKGRVGVFQLKPDDRPALLDLLSQQPALWSFAGRGFRDSIVNTIPGADKLGESGGGEGPPSTFPELKVGMEGGMAPRTFRAYGRDVIVAGAVVDGGKATWDNGVLERKSKAEQGITFGPESLRALGGRKVYLVWVSASRNEEGQDGWLGFTVGETRIDAAKKEGFKDLASHGIKINDAARGRVEAWILKPEDRKALGDLLKAEANLWDGASDQVRSALE